MSVNQTGIIIGQKKTGERPNIPPIQISSCKTLISVILFLQ